MTDKKYKLYCFSDESCTEDVFKCLGFIYCASANILHELNKQIEQLLQERGISEFKWTKVLYGADVKALKKLIDIIMQYCQEGKICIISVCINKQKMTKRKFQGYNTKELFGFLYYQVIKYITGSIEHKGVEIKLVHDEGSGFDWKNICSHLSKYFDKQKYQEILYTQQELMLIGLEEAAAYGDMYCDENKNQFIFAKNITYIDSKKSPILQVADIFAGIHGFSHNQKDSKSSRSQYKKEIIDYLMEKHAHLSYNKETGLSTPRYSNPDFWHFPKKNDIFFFNTSKI